MHFFRNRMKTLHCNVPAWKPKQKQKQNKTKIFGSKMASRFGCATEVEITEKKTKINAKNTLKSNKKAAKQLRDYLKEKKHGRNVREYD